LLETRNKPYTTTLPFIDGTNSKIKKKLNKIMKKFTLIIGIIGLLNVISSFFGNQETDKVLWIEMNIWYYRLIWSILTIGIFYDYYKWKKLEKESK
jgi:Mg2+ and Co2+ transporter CorA